MGHQFAKKLDYDPVKARNDYEELGGLSHGDVRYLAKKSKSVRNRTLNAWFGYSGSIYAKFQYEAILTEIKPTKRKTSQFG